MQIIQKLAHKTNYGTQRLTSNIKYIVIHYTANDGDRAFNNANYFQNNKNLKASAHYFVDDSNIYQSVKDDFIAYSVGGSKFSDCAKTGGGKYYSKCTNSNSISIELCDTLRNNKYDVTQSTINLALELTKYLMNKYNVPKERVIRHFDVNGKHCPAYWMDNAKWESEFHSKLSNTATGWIKDNVGWWYRNKDGSYPTSCWKTIDGKDYYFKADGYMAADEYIKSANYATDKKLYYVNVNGAWDRETYRWQQNDKGWWLSKIGSAWYPVNAWAKIDNIWYYFDDRGYMVTGTKSINGKKYTFNKDGGLI